MQPTHCVSCGSYDLYEFQTFSKFRRVTSDARSLRVMETCSRVSDALVQKTISG